MSAPPRVLVVGAGSLADGARAVLAASAARLEHAADLGAGAAALARGFRPDLLLLDVSALDPDEPPESSIDDCRRTFGCPIVGVGAERPTATVLRRVAAFLVEPYTQSEMVTAFAELLGTHPRRAGRRDVKLPGWLTDGVGRQPMTVLQLSVNGALIEADSGVAVGAPVTLSFVLPSNREHIAIAGTVVSSNELQLIYGVRFSADQPGERLAIQVFVELGLAAAAPADDPSKSRTTPA